MLILYISFPNRHDVAAIAGLTAMSFGDEDVDRYIVVYKKDFGPSEDEVHARRNGQQWTEELAKEYAQKVFQRHLFHHFYRPNR